MAQAKRKPLNISRVAKKATALQLIVQDLNAVERRECFSLALAGLPDDEIKSIIQAAKTRLEGGDIGNAIARTWAKRPIEIKRRS